ncbi:bifunctional 2-polyprenyl-6-hydroxyphenol methylase/3-demethylubiquinol 3-O-methyltransferase UbiG [Ectothiorhodospira variabilis]|uniref:bifunctional 2-polyprenyl-6-hydroxyphenol methylase/3-demethylubiquinol 3-O-methyltransferase UbiG n=1 Tax=Ectothiorhodospira variabilis TaxID=505694 RepID=UPI001EFC1F73|nr:bifunctional 2-polyprenyl-6-hydroxyphenol methylase/3-demethylubiquinol 3-O-methyltransferase UbiG [Ectothiorhodospira variabilis]MCG5495056.1 bifunctional 2-polyprenyl-6-hydroxyphenol methylase/3-demethylubiquinol 3-O-methyltransferase UbiG [Ectothiorhodospira variabilis]MCG5504643.1 bifunctional 2-polyprenyl-6-hydroxyphenol methylase/3-demethylubiquinol 3-O-methyltransferase UbiG [Ectothiorhodospira variabilis]MCG5507804.1 bifunctional 2-polyprenyl-6-hydroxyphenol methylase/3-demethylubiqui
MSEIHTNVDAAEIAKFDEMAHRWWDPEGECRPLHEINPLRLDYIDERTGGLQDQKVLDVGCGGGLLSEAMARRGARVMGIDMGENALGVARLHLLESGLEVDYRQTSAEALAAEMPGQFDVVTCMEMLEHVPDPGSVLDACARLLKPGAHLCVATLNRTPKSFAMAILGAEYLMRMLPPGTHEYARFIRPSEMEAWMRQAGLSMRNLTGMHYDLLNRSYRLGPGVDVNYLAHAMREA